MVSGCVKDIDRDTDGRIDRHELVIFAINLTGQILALQKKNQSWMKTIKNYRRGLVAAVGIVVLLCASLFGVSVAVAELTKDVAVSSKGVMTRAGTDDLIKTGVSGFELVALAPADDQPVNQEDGFLGCLVQDQVDLLSSESFFTGTVLDSPDGSKHVIQVHDYEKNSSGDALIVDTSGKKYLIKTNDKSCGAVMTRDGRRLDSNDVFASVQVLNMNPHVVIELYTSVDVSDTEVDIFESTVTVSSFDTYNEQAAACVAQGMRLCRLDELCPTRGVLGAKSGQASFPRGFDIPGSVATSDSWVAYDTSGWYGPTHDNCGDAGGCAGNGWVQIGTWAGGHTCKTHCEVTAELYNAAMCPSWGTVDGGAYTPNSYICCHYPSVACDEC